MNHARKVQQNRKCQVAILSLEQWRQYILDQFLFSLTTAVQTVAMAISIIIIMWHCICLYIHR